MKKRVLVGIALAALIASAVLVAARRAPSGSTTPAAAPRPLPQVVVKHDYITVPLVAARTLAPPSFSRSASAPTRRSVVASRRAEQPALLERARRALVGDGRYRPEPFPRLRQQ